MIEFEKTFDNTAEDYDKIRPAYGKELFEDIFKYKQIDAGSKVLEIGIGTGKATLPVLEKKCCVTALEPGENLADIALERYKNYDNFSLYKRPLQDFVCPAETFDMIYSATAFHWIPEEYGYSRVYELLKSGGAFARFAYHAGADKGRKELTSEIQSLYKNYMGHKDAPPKYCEQDARKVAQIAAQYGFMDIRYRLYHMEKDFTADEYIMLLKTYPDHMCLKQPERDKLFSGIYAAINKNGGVITVYYTIDLQLARKP